MSNEPVPQRLSDAERDAAIEMLREHLEAGRLDQTEFGERLDRALTARYATDLTELFADLPDPRPSSPDAWGQTAWSTAPSPYASPSSPGGAMEVRPDAPVAPTNTSWMPMARAMLWPVAIVLALITSEWFLFIAIAIIGGIVLTQLESRNRKPPPYLGQ